MMNDRENNNAKRLSLIENAIGVTCLVLATTHHWICSLLAGVISSKKVLSTPSDILNANDEFACLMVLFLEAFAIAIVLFFVRNTYFEAAARRLLKDEIDIRNYESKFRYAYRVSFFTVMMLITIIAISLLDSNLKYDGRSLNFFVQLAILLLPIFLIHPLALLKWSSKQTSYTNHQTKR